jgi:hypothetical protein
MQVSRTCALGCILLFLRQYRFQFLKSSGILECCNVRKKALLHFRALRMTLDRGATVNLRLISWTATLWRFDDDNDQPVYVDSLLTVPNGGRFRL